MKDRDEIGLEIVAFRCPKDLVSLIESAAAAEGISKSDIARRACIRDLMPTARPDSLKHGAGYAA